jgi:hypothetical protein
MLCSKLVSICTIHESHTLPWPSAFYDTSKALLTLACSYIALLFRIFLLTLILIRLVVLTLAVLPLAMVCFLGTI